NLGSKPGDIFENLLRLARSKKASDLHILADRHAMLRIGGDMVKVGPKLSADMVEKMLMPEVPERLHEELARDGSVDYALTHFSLGRFRTNVSRQRTGMKLTARPISDNVPTLAELALPDSIANATHHHQGLIVITGPTGHGKTSTMAALIDVINRERSDHIITVEDPIEYVHPRKKAVISQREVGTHTKKFANALKGSLREDPDVIVVGELRDTETVRMALSASETGHLVISTMNTPSAAKAIERLIDLFPPGDQPQVRMSLSGGLRMITSQRLVPSADRKTVKAAVEILPGSAPLWALIRDNKTFQIPSLQQRGKALGIVRLDDSLAELVRSGHTTLEIAREYADAPEQLEAVVRGAPVKAPEAPAPANDPTAGAQKFGKDMLSKAGKLFGGEK
ncbi:MAG TPA: PilT/PilU family type 4a pilus ATPase, partial [Polyangiales bacterium]